MLKIGITGGIGTGKSEVSRIFETLGAKIFYADDIAKQFLDTDKDVKNQIKQLFGGDIYNQSDTINRKRLANLIFNDTSLKIQVEKIIHPVVIKYLKEQFLRIEKEKKTKLVFIEAALIFEAGVDKILDFVIVVDAPKEICIKRVMERDGTKIEEVIKRINSQLANKKKVDMADFVIYNDDTKDKLESNVKFIYNLLNSISEKENEYKR